MQAFVKAIGNIYASLFRWGEQDLSLNTILALIFSLSEHLSLLLSFFSVQYLFVLNLGIHSYTLGKQQRFSKKLLYKK